MNTHIEIAEGVLAKLIEVNPTIDSSRFQLALDVVVRSIEELYGMIPATVGKQVWVIPGESAFVDYATRSQDRNSYAVGIVAVDRLDPPNEHLTNPDHHAELFAWAKERIGWVKDYIRVPLAATNFPPIEGATISNWFVNETIDRQMLREHGIFWSDLDFIYEIDETNH